MDENRKNAYFAGTICIFIFVVLALIAFTNELNLSGLLFWVLTLFFGILGFGSFWKPDWVGPIASKIVKMLFGSDSDKSDSHNSQTQKNSSDSVQVMAGDGANITMVTHGGRINTNTNSKELGVYSIIHSMIVRVNKKLPREKALTLTGAGAFIEASVIDVSKISALFNQNSDKFRDEDLSMWIDIEKEIKEVNGFYLDKDRQEWFDYLEAEYNRQKKAKK